MKALILKKLESLKDDNLRISLTEKLKDLETSSTIKEERTYKIQYKWKNEIKILPLKKDEFSDLISKVSTDLKIDGIANKCWFGTQMYPLVLSIYNPSEIYSIWIRLGEKDDIRCQPFELYNHVALYSESLPQSIMYPNKTIQDWMEEINIVKPLGFKINDPLKELSLEHPWHKVKETYNFQKKSHEISELLNRDTDSILKGNLKTIIFDPSDDIITTIGNGNNSKQLIDKLEDQGKAQRFENWKSKLSTYRKTIDPTLILDDTLFYYQTTTTLREKCLFSTVYKLWKTKMDPILMEFSKMPDDKIDEAKAKCSTYLTSTINQMLEITILEKDDFTKLGIYEYFNKFTTDNMTTTFDPIITDLCINPMNECKQIITKIEENKKNYEIDINTTNVLKQKKNCRTIFFLVESLLNNTTTVTLAKIRYLGFLFSLQNYLFNLFNFSSYIHECKEKLENLITNFFKRNLRGFGIIYRKGFDMIDDKKLESIEDYFLKPTEIISMMNFILNPKTKIIKQSFSTESKPQNFVFQFIMFIMILKTKREYLIIDSKDETKEYYGGEATFPLLISHIDFNLKLMNISSNLWVDNPDLLPKLNSNLSLTINRRELTALESFGEFLRKSNINSSNFEELYNYITTFYN